MVFGKLKKQFPNVRRNEPLKNHCTLRVGGPADFFYELKNTEELPALISFAEENAVKYRLIGGGTNVLFTDKGFRGLIIKNLAKNCRREGLNIICDSGAILGQVIRLSVDNKLTGLESLFGVPGTMGGAIWGNAGANGVEISDFLTSVTVFNAGDGIREIPRKAIKFVYRRSSLQECNDTIMQVKLKLKSLLKVKEELLRKINAIRMGKQPAGFSAGCFFKNPKKGQPAGLLIDEAGLKGKRIGDAQISPKHANFFVNLGRATSGQILELAKLARETVKRKFAVDLEMEVKIIGDL